jgi:hypothetical protein
LKAAGSNAGEPFVAVDAVDGVDVVAVADVAEVFGVVVFDGRL